MVMKTQVTIVDLQKNHLMRGGLRLMRLIATRTKKNADSDKVDGESCNDYDSIDIHVAVVQER